MTHVRSQILQLMEERAYQKALDILLRAIEKREDAQLCSLAGRCYYLMEDNANAIKFLLKAIELEPDRAEYYTKLGMAYESLGETQKAIESYNRALIHYTDIVFVMKRLETLQNKDAA